MSVNAYCWYAGAENTQMRRIAAADPELAAEVAAFIASPQWIDMNQVFKESWITGGSSSLKAIAPLAGHTWPVDDPGGGLSMVKHVEATIAGASPVREQLGSGCSTTTAATSKPPCGSGNGSTGKVRPGPRSTPGDRITWSSNEKVERSMTPGTYRVSDGVAVHIDEHRNAVQGRSGAFHLLTVAQTYNSFVTYSELAERLQTVTGVRTRMLMHYWIGDVLGAVARRCHELGEPLLSSLCVHADQTVGSGYGVTEEAYGQTP